MCRHPDHTRVCDCARASRKYLSRERERSCGFAKTPTNEIVVPRNVFGSCSWQARCSDNFTRFGHKLTSCKYRATDRIILPSTMKFPNENWCNVLQRQDCPRLSVTSRCYEIFTMVKGGKEAQWREEEGRGKGGETGSTEEGFLSGSARRSVLMRGSRQSYQHRMHPEQMLPSWLPLSPRLARTVSLSLSL